MEKLSVDRCLSPAVDSFFFFLVIVWLAIAMLRYRKTQPLSVFCVVALAVWYFTASYDIRNAEIPFCLVAVTSVVLVVRTASAAKTRGPKSKAIALAVALPLLLLSLPGLAHKPLQTLGLLARRPLPPDVWTADAPGRLRFFKPSSDLVNILDAAPYGTGATHVLAGNHDYRLFGERGVYATQLNAFESVAPGDVCLRIPAFMPPPPEPFLLAAFVRRALPHRELWMASPADPVEVPFSLENDILSPENAPPCGILELEFDDPVPEDASLACTNAEGDAALFAKYVQDAKDGKILRLLYWTGTAQPPSFRYSGPPPASCRLRSMP